ncbi:hypothetical protein MFLO_12596 [Listeria floridensis FSL S10-1187]|uniref:Knr4/Smi1-like domain-containing protein n=1 Tax=Listeria floridensis FSL S10-1187 TaxID=1265817 RepID=A0ABN0RD15_9LIST|nr:SMI1/KNR4 family protein [Listeria floridensis]EUJ28005.1 hypothetical protein MFLO_12596 [Listeria floridensis FSL S10-1187]
MWPNKLIPGAHLDAIRVFEKEHHVALPARYKEWISRQDGGLLKKNRLKTTEPTSYDLDGIEIYRLLGLNELITEKPASNQNPLSGKKIYFSQDETRYLGFDYKRTEPEIIYVDFETLQVLSVAPNFDAFLDALYFEPFPIENAERFSHDKLEQISAGLTASECEELLLTIEDEADKDWYFSQLNLLADRGAAEAAARLFENQILYFKRKLPARLVTEMFESLKAKSVSLDGLKKEWNSTD